MSTTRPIRKGLRYCTECQDSALRHLQHDGDPAGQRDRGRRLPARPGGLPRKGVELRGCPQTCRILDGTTAATTDADWDESISPRSCRSAWWPISTRRWRTLRNMARCTESIVTENITKARRFLREVDASSVMVNASTRFADGFEYGLGAEIGISTDKFRAWPGGLEGLTSVKYIVLGDGHVRT